jgi:hypothetical protein
MFLVPSLLARRPFGRTTHFAVRNSSVIPTSQPGDDLEGQWSAQSENPPGHLPLACRTIRTHILTRHRAPRPTTARSTVTGQLAADTSPLTYHPIRTMRTQPLPALSKYPYHPVTTRAPGVTNVGSNSTSSPRSRPPTTRPQVCNPALTRHAWRMGPMAVRCVPSHVTQCRRAGAMRRALEPGAPALPRTLPSTTSCGLSLR